MQELISWVSSGKLKYQEHIVEGLENAPEALQLLFNGGNKGKLMVAIAKPSDATKPAAKL